MDITISSGDQDDDTGATQPLIESKVAMTPAQSRFYASERCLTARMALQQLVDSPQYETGSSYSAGYGPGFIDRHLYYLSTHPGTTLEGYISNLKLMTRIRPGGNNVR